ncbi:hypothetical protein KJ980_05495 [Patescibacteria group bacterium]|nr:hypothetical protein [Patescibacteria group bacterium]MBU4016847.1 hypothetical protein [Patescibacteria group bacterium]MBU4099075.1 hypothetical protein [Patescibacteria group bacterium]
MKNNLNIRKPSRKEVERYLRLWNTLENYTLQESSLEKLFTKTYPLNNNLDDVLIKVCSLNDFYSTNIFSPFTVAKHIILLNIDGNFAKDDLEIVNKIAEVEMKGGKTKNFYSFATKYCSHHKPLIYPIYDSYVDKMLMRLKEKDKFSNFSRQDLRLYQLFKKILIDFRKFYGLEQFNLKQIDQYLWQAGKKYFPKNYGKSSNEN